MKGGRITILGFARSGFALAKALQQEGEEIFISELRPTSDCPMDQQNWLQRTHAPAEFGGHTPAALEGCRRILVSPGVPWDLPLLEDARSRKIPVMAELEFAAQKITAPIIAVTGTNGKTTTTILVGEILKAAGFDVRVAGNIGLPTTELIHQQFDVAVLEVSSYQLEGIDTFRPKIAVILNITPDHLERHKTLSHYANLKARIFTNQASSDYCIFNADDPEIGRIIQNCQSTRLTFGRAGEGSKDAVFNEEYIHTSVRANAGIKILLKECALPGEHNTYNMMAALLSALTMGVSPEIIRHVLHSFQGAPHRIERLGNWQGVEYINDSKATNPESSIVALKALSVGNRRRIILIAGGLDKGTDITSWVRSVRQFAKEVILLGQAAPRFSEALSSGGFPHFSTVSGLAEALEEAQKKATPGDYVLLSPACASFDMFRNFEERGDQFRKLVQGRFRKVSSQMNP